MLAPINRPCRLRESLFVRTFSDLELIGGKVKALFDRIVVRDLYDVANLCSYLDNFLVKYPGQADLCRKLMLYHASISKHFPLPFAGRVSDRFTGRETELKNQLYPMLRNGDRPSLKSLIVIGEEFLDRYVLPQTDAEWDYLAHFSKADYQPKLLFEGYPNVIKAAEANPEALWKLENLKKMTSNTDISCR